jgi:hypothetical protein
MLDENDALTRFEIVRRSADDRPITYTIVSIVIGRGYYAERVMWGS